MISTRVKSTSASIIYALATLVTPHRAAVAQGKPVAAGCDRPGGCVTEVVLDAAKRQWALREDVLFIPGDIVSVALRPGPGVTLGKWMCKWDTEEKACWGLCTKTVHQKQELQDIVDFGGGSVVMTALAGQKKLGDFRVGTTVLGPSVIARRGYLTLSGVSTKPAAPRGEGCNYEPTEPLTDVSHRIVVEIRRAAR